MCQHWGAGDASETTQICTGRGIWAFPVEVFSQLTSCGCLPHRDFQELFYLQPEGMRQIILSSQHGVLGELGNGAQCTSDSLCIPQSEASQVEKDMSGSCLVYNERPVNERETESGGREWIYPGSQSSRFMAMDKTNMELAFSQRKWTISQ
ncbi:uncharacterized protein WM277_026278 isoform 3-T3 [Molossus nigricans]